MATRISSKARRAATGSDKSILGSMSIMAASSGSIMTGLPRVRRGYFGCILMPASIRIDSALMYELDNSSTANEANSVE